MARDNELRRRQAGSSSGPSSPTKSTTSATPSSPKAASTSTKLSRASNALNNLKPHHDPLDLQIKADDDGSLKILAPGTPLDEIDLSEIPLLHHLQAHPPKTLLHQLKSTRIIFPLGLLVGALLAYFLISPLDPDALDMYSKKLSLMYSDLSLSVDNSLANIALPSDILAGLKNFSANPFDHTPAFEWMKNYDFDVGLRLQEEGLKAEFPVILIPGIISTGLESWSTTPEARPWFRKRLWGTASMIKAILADRNKWMDALRLDLETGLDPPGHRIRAAQGFDAASQFIQGYWVWQKIIENLAPLGYDSSNLELAAYDWRLSYYNLEVRDHYFSYLKIKCEMYRKTHGKKVILVGHSMGGTIILYFLKWVEASGPVYGNGGPTWVEDNIESFVNIAGPMLGVAKAMSAFLSGEMRDTVEVNPAASYMLEKMFSRKERAGLFQGWAGSASMWLKGGNFVWGNTTFAPDDPLDATDTHGRFISFRDEAHPSGSDLKAEHISPNLTMGESNDFILGNTPPTFQKMFGTNYSAGMETDVARLKANAEDHTKWTNPLEVQLPYAPNLKIFCLYGHGKETERSYWYVKGPYKQGDHNSSGTEISADGPALNLTGTTPLNPLNLPLSRDLWIDSDVSLPAANPSIRSGVKFGEGDGTVPLLSLGAMCVEGWKRKEWNPAGVRVVTREQSHKPEALDLRGGVTTGDHIDILGSKMLNEAVGRIAAGRGDELQDSFVSDIQRYASSMDWEGALAAGRAGSWMGVDSLWKKVVGE